MDWVDLGTALFSGASGLPSTLAFDNNTGGNDIVTADHDIIAAENGKSKVDLRTGSEYTIEGTQIGGAPLVGFSYYLSGDWSFNILVGSDINVRNTPLGVNDGIHTLTAVHYDGVNTRIQWAGMVTELGTPFGKFTTPTDGWAMIGQDDAKFQIQDFGGGFTLTSMINKVSDEVFTEFYSFFGYVYNWSVDTADANPANHRRGGLTIHSNLFSSGAVTSGTQDSFPISASVSRADFAVGAKNIFVGGAQYIHAKTDNAAYSNQFIINKNGVGVSGHIYETVIDAVLPTADRKQWMQDKDGTIALLSDITGAESLTATLTAGDTMADGQTINSLNGDGQLDLRQGANNVIALTNANGAYTKAWFYGAETTAQFGYGAAATMAFADQITTTTNYNYTGQYSLHDIVETGYRMAVVNTAGGQTGEILLGNNSAGNWGGLDVDQFPSSYSSRNVWAVSGVYGSVALGGVDIRIQSANTAYVTKLGYSNQNIVGNFETLVSFTTPTANRDITFQDGSGTLAFLSDTTGGNTLSSVLSNGQTSGLNDIVMSNNAGVGDLIRSSDGKNFLSLESNVFATNLGINLIYDGASYYTTFQSKAYLILNGSGTSIGSSYLAANLTGTQTSIFANSTGASNTAVGFNLQNGDPADRKDGQFGIVDNKDGDRLIQWNLYPTAEMFSSVASSPRSLFKQNVYNSFAAGGQNIIIKTNNTAYVNQIAFNDGLAGEMKLVHTASATDYTATLQAKSGTQKITPIKGAKVTSKVI